MADRRALAQILVAAVFFSTVSVAGSVAAVTAGPEASVVIAVFLPGTSLSESLAAVEASGASVTGFGPAGWVLTATASVPGAPIGEALSENGAVWLLSADLSDWLCGPTA